MAGFTLGVQTALLLYFGWYDTCMIQWESIPCRPKQVVLYNLGVGFAFVVSPAVCCTGFCVVCIVSYVVLYCVVLCVCFLGGCLGGLMEQTVLACCFGPFSWPVQHFEVQGCGVLASAGTLD
jgi:hypothetical protein